MGARLWRPGEILYCEDGSAVVVQPGCTPIEGLLDLLEQAYGGPRFADTNPTILAAAADTQVGVWRSCTKAWRESECVDAEDWWSPEGDGKRSITVAYYSGNIDTLGAEAEETEVT